MLLQLLKDKAQEFVLLLLSIAAFLLLAEVGMFAELAYFAVGCSLVYLFVFIMRAITFPRSLDAWANGRLPTKDELEGYTGFDKAWWFLSESDKMRWYWAYFASSFIAGALLLSAVF